MILLKYHQTVEDCPNCESDYSYLHDNQEEKTCMNCGTVWNRIDGNIIERKK